MMTAVVTGCAGGLGTALCSAFQASGYQVIGTDRVRGTSSCDTFVEIDLLQACRTSEQLQDAVSLLRSKIDRQGLAVLVNNAAIQILGPTEELTLEDWQASVTVNVTAPLFLTQALLPDLRRGHGSVVNIGSVHARATKPRFVAYATTKAALVGLTRAMAVDLAPHVRVLAVNPGAIDTSMLRAGFADRAEALNNLAAMQPLGRIATPEEISKVVVFLASESASFATGCAIDIDGGILSRLHDPE